MWRGLGGRSKWCARSSSSITCRSSGTATASRRTAPSSGPAPQFNSTSGFSGSSSISSGFEAYGSVIRSGVRLRHQVRPPLPAGACNCAMCCLGSPPSSDQTPGRVELHRRGAALSLLATGMSVWSRFRRRLHYTMHIIYVYIICEIYASAGVRPTTAAATSARCPSSSAFYI